MRSTTTGMATGDLIPGATKERASFIHAVNVGLNDLETRRDVSILMTPLSALDWTEMEDRHDRLSGKSILRRWKDGNCVNGNHTDGPPAKKRSHSARPYQI